jgi:hypothetical protein
LVMRNREKTPASLVGYGCLISDTLCPDNGGSSGSGYWLYQ